MCYRGIRGSTTATESSLDFLPVNFSRLQSVLHAAAPLIHGVHRYDHVTPLLRQLHWLYVPERVNFKLCVMVYRCLHGLGPEYFSQTTSNSCPRFILARLRSVSSTDATSWFLPHAGLHLATAHFWSQELGHGTRYRPSTPYLCSLRRLLKTYLFQRQLHG